MTEMIEPMAAQIDQQRLAQELVEQARAEGVELVGASGLLTRLTKSVLETCGCRTGHPRHADLGVFVDQPAEQIATSEIKRGLRCRWW